MARKQRIGIFDLGRLPLSDVAQPQGDAVPAGSLKQFRERERARENEEARIAEQERLQAIETARLAELTSPASVRVAKYFRQPIQELQTDGADFAPVDAYGKYETGPRDAGAEDTAENAFLADLASRGCTLYRAGLLRLTAYLETLALTRGVSLTSVSNWQTALARLHSLSVFEPHELEGYPPATKTVEQPRVEPTAEQMFDELLRTTSGETREGKKILEDAVQRAAVHGEYHATWSAFEASLFQNFGGFVLTPIQRQTFYDTMLRRGMSFHRPKDYDTVRVALAKSGDLPNLLYPQERLELEMEMSDLNDREVRRKFAQRSRELNTKSLI